MTPAAGKVVIWANMKKNWWKMDKAAMHQAVPVRFFQAVLAGQLRSLFYPTSPHMHGC